MSFLCACIGTIPSPFCPIHESANSGVKMSADEQNNKPTHFDICIDDNCERKSCVDRRNPPKPNIWTREKVDELAKREGWERDLSTYEQARDARIKDKYSTASNDEGAQMIAGFIEAASKDLSDWSRTYAYTQDEVIAELVSAANFSPFRVPNVINSYITLDKKDWGRLQKALAAFEAEKKKWGKP